MGARDYVQDGGAVACSTKQAQLSEGIRWDARRDEMLAVDILAGRVARGQIRDDGSLDRIALGLLVVIRTILSFSIDIEISGALPWRSPATETAASDRRTGDR